MQDTGKQDRLIRIVGISALTLIVFTLLNNIIWGRQFGTGMQYHGGYGWAPGLDLNWLVAAIIALAVKLLWLVFIISIIIGLLALIKKHGAAEGKIDWSFFEGLVEAGTVCSSCGSKVKASYNYCCGCGQSVNNESGEEHAPAAESGKKKPSRPKKGGNTDE